MDMRVKAKKAGVDLLTAQKLNALLSRNLECQYGAGLRAKMAGDRKLRESVGRSAVIVMQNMGMHGFQIFADHAVHYWSGAEAKKRFYDDASGKWTCTTYCWMEEGVVREMLREIIDLQVRRKEARIRGCPATWADAPKGYDKTISGELVVLEDLVVTVPQKAWWQRRVPTPTNGSPQYRITAYGTDWIYDMLNIVDLLNRFTDDLDFSIL